MFLVSDSVDSRHRRIREFFQNGDASIAILLAVIDLERTLRRAILALGCTPTKELNAQMRSRRPNRKPGKPIGYRSGLDGLHDAWKHEVQRWLHVKLPRDLSPRWTDVRRACDIRNELVHGSRARTSPKFAMRPIDAALDLSRRIQDLALQQGHDLQKPVRRRLKEHVR